MKTFRILLSLCCTSHTCHNSFCPAPPAHAVDSPAAWRTSLVPRGAMPVTNRRRLSRSPRLQWSSVRSMGRREFGATYRFDYVELLNTGSATIDLATWAINHASSTGTTWQRTALERTGRAGTAIPDPAGLWRGERSRPRRHPI
jgi:hypothetical protein